MRQVYRALCLVLLLIGAQQGAVVHELSHFYALHGPDVQNDSGGVAEGNCALCPAFAQVVTPAFSHSFDLPSLLRAAAERSSEPPIEGADAAIPTPRSRGPPSLS
ncbi:MAG: hypothetical protein ACLP2F_16735 [Steroidobacteraceae bacterium]